MNQMTMRINNSKKRQPKLLETSLKILPSHNFFILIRKRLPRTAAAAAATGHSNALNQQQQQQHRRWSSPLLLGTLSVPTEKGAALLPIYPLVLNLYH